MSREPASMPLVWVLFYAWAVAAVVGLAMMLMGGIFSQENDDLLLKLGGVILFIATPVLFLARYLMPRHWTRAMDRQRRRRSF